MTKVPWMVTPIEFLGVDAEITGSSYLPSKVIVTIIILNIMLLLIITLIIISILLFSDQLMPLIQGKEAAGAAAKSSSEGAKSSVFQARNQIITSFRMTTNLYCH